MRLTMRYGLVGVAALAMLTAVHRLREDAMLPQPAGVYLLGVLPNFAAAVAITFVLLGIWSDQDRDAVLASTERRFLICASVSGFVLLAWEVLQTLSKQLVFDLHDLGATLVGLGAAVLIFYAVTPRARART